MKEKGRKGTWWMVQAGMSFVYKTPLPRVEGNRGVFCSEDTPAWVEGKTVYCWFSLA